MRSQRTITTILLLLIPLLLLAGCSNDDHNRTVTAGDDTYVPNFQAGNLSFTDVWVPDVAQASGATTIWFDITAEQPKYNVFVKLDLFKLQSGSIAELDGLNLANVQPDYQVTALVIENLATGETRHIEHTFPMPPTVADGTYAAVFSVNQYDFTPADDALQGEAAGDGGDNFVVAPASIIIGRPDLPNLRILSTSLANYSFGLNKVAASNLGNASAGSALSVNLEVESMGQHTLSPVEIVFDLDIPNVGRFPLYLAKDKTLDSVTLDSSWTYPVLCRDIVDDVVAVIPAEAGEPPPLDQLDPQSALPPPTSTVCASLFRQSQVGQTYELYLPEAAIQALQGLSVDTAANLLITVDPDNTIAEYQNNKVDNSKSIPVIFLPPEPVDITQPARASLEHNNGPYPYELFRLGYGDKAGNDWAGYDWNVGPRVSWDYTLADPNDTNSSKIPTAFYAGLDNYISAILFRNQLIIFGAGANLDFNADNITGSGFDYGVNILGLRIFGAPERITIGTIRKQPGQTRYDLWNSRVEVDGYEREKYAAFRELTKFSQRFWLSWIPILVETQIVGQFGIRGEVKFDEANKLQLMGGPFVGATLRSKGVVDLLVAQGGVKGTITLIDIGLNALVYLQYQPSNRYATLGFGLPIRLSTLNGSLSAYGEWTTWGWKPWSWYSQTNTIEQVLLSWKGWNPEFNFLNWALEPYQQNVFGNPYFRIEIPKSTLDLPL